MKTDAERIAELERRVTELEDLFKPRSFAMPTGEMNIKDAVFTSAPPRMPDAPLSYGPEFTVKKS